jgi:gliding motility-associated lipoprotein GldH
MSRHFTNIIVLGIIFLSVSCKNLSVYDASIDIPKETWTLDSIAKFKVDIVDTSSVHNILVNIRNTNDYPNSNLYLFIQTTSPTGATLRDTLECILADDKGNWLGKGFGAIHDSQFPYKDFILFPEKGIYVFDIQQGMRTHSLKGIASIGLRVEKVNE